VTLLAPLPPAALRARPVPVAGAGVARRVRATDVSLLVAAGLWAASMATANVDALDDFGLLGALPLTYFAAIVLLVAGAAALVTAPALSPVRLALHLVGLVVMVHAAAPLLFDVPIYSWVYKHIGVVDYISANGHLDPGIDIYHNWPAFFALAAWFGEVAGLDDPVRYAAWAPVYFNLVSCLVLRFAFRGLGLPARATWVALFLFVGGNWVGQDYFAPQALAFVLSVAVTGMVVRWLRDDRRPRVVTVVGTIAHRLVPRGRSSGAEPAEAVLPSRRAVVIPLVVAAFAAVVVTHQLSPFVVLLAVGGLTATGQVRPRWLVVVMGAMAVGYVSLHYDYLDRTQDLFSQLLNPLRNLNGNGMRDPRAMPGRQLTALGAPLVVALLAALAGIGTWRRLRGRQPVLVAAVLAASPALVALGQSYGGEAVFRIYLFAVPWMAALAAMAIVLPWRRPRWARPLTGAALGVAVLGLLSAFYGSMGLYEVGPGSVRASRYFYEHAPPGSLLTFVGPGFPVRASGGYAHFDLPPDDSKPNLLRSVDAFRHRQLGQEDLPAIGDFMRERIAGSNLAAFMVLSAEQAASAEVMGFLPAGSVAGLESALRASPDWTVFYDDVGAVIFRFSPLPDEPAAPAPEEVLVEDGAELDALAS
jgi:hypothetical protein